MWLLLTGNEKFPFKKINFNREFSLKWKSWWTRKSISCSKLKLTLNGRFYSRIANTWSGFEIENKRELRKSVMWKIELRESLNSQWLCLSTYQKINRQFFQLFRVIQQSHPVCNTIMLFGVITCLISVILLGIDGQFVDSMTYPKVSVTLIMNRGQKVCFIHHKSTASNRILMNQLHPTTIAAFTNPRFCPFVYQSGLILLWKATQTKVLNILRKFFAPTKSLRNNLKVSPSLLRTRL